MPADRSDEATLGVGGARRTDSQPLAHWPAEQITFVRELAESICRRVGACYQLGDWNVAVKAAVLVRRFGEHWLNDACEGTKRRRENRALERINPWAYFTFLLQKSTRKLGCCLNRELARITLPAELQRPQRPSEPTYAQRRAKAIADREPPVC